MKSNAGPREVYIDYAKGIGILLVVLGHISQIEGAPRVFITSFHMPLFFIIAGILMFRAGEPERPLGNLIRRKARRILIPYVSFSVLTIPIYAVMSHLLGEDPNTAAAAIRSDILSTLSMSGRSVLWFLPALFASEVLFLMLLKKLPLPAATAVTVLLAAAGIFLGDYVTAAFTPYNTIVAAMWLYYLITAVLRAMICTVFLAAGFIMSKLAAGRRLGPGPAFACGAPLLAFTLAASLRNGITDLHFRVFGNPALYFPAALAGSFGVLLLSQSLEARGKLRVLQYLSFLGRNSLVIMVTHLDFYVLYAAELGALYLSGILPHGRFVGFIGLTFVLAMAGETVLIQVINRFFPFLMGNKRAEV